MSFSTLPISYCTNVHPGQTVDEVIHGLQEYTIPARQKLGQKIAAGLWLPAAVIEEIEQDSAKLERLKEIISAGDLVCYTLNTFPYGNFHSERVKENVYIPDWTTPERLKYTASCAQVLAELLPPGTEGSLSTVPLGFKGFEHPPTFEDDCIAKLLNLAEQLDNLHDATGQVIRLAIEPEPLCVIETTPEAIAFFKKLYTVAEQRGLLDQAQRHLGLCYDVCHQAVEFEDVTQSIHDLREADIRINKIHITCAIHIDQPDAAKLAELAHFIEQRYLHQTFAKSSSGEVVHATDLNEELCTQPSAGFQDAEAWRVHFHVPVNQESIGMLGTTRPELVQALAAVRELDYAPHLEVETYTWGVLPNEEKPSLVNGLLAELNATLELLSDPGKD